MAWGALLWGLAGSVGLPLEAMTDASWQIHDSSDDSVILATGIRAGVT